LTVAGSNGKGNQLNQLSSPEGIYVDDDHQCIYISDYGNDRIVEWKYDAKISQLVAGGNDAGNRMDQLSYPRDVIVDKKTDSLIICDRSNDRVVQWPRRNGKNGETIISDIDCWGLTMDNNEHLYVSDVKKNEVRRWKIGEKTNGIIVAGGNGNGNNFNQLNHPTYLFVDKDYSVYVLDANNHRVMKWMKDAKEGIVVAGGQGQGNSLIQLFNSLGIVADQLRTVYVIYHGNNRVMCCPKEPKQVTVVIDENGNKIRGKQFKYLCGLSMNRLNNLYIIDNSNQHVKEFSFKLN